MLILVLNSGSSSVKYDIYTVDEKSQALVAGAVEWLIGLVFLIHPLPMPLRAMKKYIGAYGAILGGLDALVFTAGIGENCPQVRKWVCEDMSWMGIAIDPSANSREKTVISRSDSQVLILVIPTNEEVVIARETYRVASQLSMRI